MFLTHALRAIYRAAVVTGDSLWKYVSLLLSGTPPSRAFNSDASVNNNVLTLSGDVRPSNLNPYVEGYYSNYFDGSGDWLSFTGSPGTTLSGDFTVEAWVYLNNVSTLQPIVCIGDSFALPGIMFYVASDAKLAIAYGGSRTFTGTGVATVNTWAHVAFVRSGTTVTGYLNGVSQGTLTTSSTFSGTTTHIGREIYNTGTGGQFFGNMSNVRLVKGTAVYTANFTPSTTPLTAVSGTSLLTCQSNRFIDNSANNFALTKTGDVAVRGFVPFTPPTTVNVNTLYSTYFDGTGDTLNLPASTALLGSGNYTVEFWVNLPTAPAGGAYFTCFAYGSTGSVLRCFLLDSTGTKLGIWIGTVNVVMYATTAMVGQWAHIALVRSGTTLTAYINGTNVATASDTTNYNAGQLYIASQAATNYLAGTISNFRVVVGTAVYTANFTPSTTPLTAITNTSLLTCQNATLRDNSTNAFAITSSGQAQPILQSPFTQVTTPVAATYLGASYLDGTGDYLTTSGAYAFGTANFTIETWVYTTAYPGSLYAAIFGNITTVTGDTQVILSLNSSGNVVFLTWGTVMITTSAVVPLNTWAHIAAVRDGAAYKVYINGVLAGTSTTMYNLSTPGVANIGYAGMSGINNFTGYVSDMRVVQGTAVYTANFAPPATPLTAVSGTTLLTCQTDQPAANKQFIDNSGSNLVITQAGNATQGSFSPYGANWSNYFDGSTSYLNAAATLIPTTQSTFTIEAWVYMTAAPNGTFIPGMCGDMLGGSNTNYMSFGPVTISGTRYVGFYWYDPTQRNCYGGTTPLNLNTWYHIAISISSNVIKMFVNGVSQTITYSSGVTGLTNRGGTTSGFTVGGFNAATNSYIGNISNLHVVNGTAVYTTDFTPPTAPLTAVANTALLTCQGPSFTDSSTSARALTRTGTVSAQRFSPFSPVIQTPVSYSTYFDGTGDYLDLANNTVFSQTGSWTLEMWVFPTVAVNNYVYSQATANFLQINISGTNYVNIDRSGVGNLIVSTNPISLNVWTHLALVSDGTNMKLFINGTQSGSTAAVGTQATSAAVTRIGAYQATGSLAYQGYISNLRLVKGTAVYTTTFTPPTTPLTAISGTGLLTCQSPTIIDNSTNAFPITVSGNAIARSQNPFGFTNTTTGLDYTPALFGGSAYFDGASDYLTVASGASGALGNTCTIEFWMYPTSAPGNARVINNSTSSVDVNYSSGVVQFFNGPYANTIISLNSWTHVACTLTSGTVKIFLNGVSQPITGTSTGFNLTSTADIWIGGISGFAQWYPGYLSDVRITKGQALYTGGFVPPIAPLQAVKNTVLLLNMDKAGETDSSRSVDLETVGDAKIVSETPYAGSYYSNYFDGTGDYISAAGANLALGTGDFTIECWFYRMQNGRADGIYTAGRSPSASGGFGVKVFTDNKLYWNTNTSYGGGTGVTINAGQWYHIAITRQSSTLKWYVNGVLDYTGASFTQDCTNQFALFGITDDPTYTNMYISNARIVKGSAIYTANFTPPTAPLTAVAGTSLLTCQSKSFVDNSSNAYPVTRYGDTAVKSMNPFQKNAYSSMYFDGTGDYLVAPSMLTATGDFTIECWINTTVAVSGYRMLCGGGIDTSATNYLAIYASGVEAQFGSAAATVVTAAYTFVPGAWYHVAMTRSGSTIRVFVNGVSLTTSQGTQTAAFAFRYIANGYAGLIYTGYIADFRFTNGAARYTAAFTPPTAPLPTS